MTSSFQVLRDSLKSQILLDKSKSSLKAFMISLSQSFKSFVACPSPKSFMTYKSSNSKNKIMPEVPKDKISHNGQDADH